MKTRRNHVTMPGKRVRRRQRAQIRRMQKQIDALRNRLCADIAVPVKTGAEAPSAAMIYSSELSAIQRHVLQYPNLETGGELYGWYSETGLPIIAFATGPGTNATHGATRFRADEQYSMAIGRKMVNNGLQNVGSWHSHHKLSLAQPSGIDCGVMQASLSGHDSPLRRFICGIANIVGEKVTFNAYYFSSESGLNYSRVPIVVREWESPVRIGLNKVLGPFEQEGDVI